MVRESARRLARTYWCSDREREMRFTRKTIMALSVSGALTVAAGVSASAAVLDLPILGFGEAASEQSAPPKVVHRTVYDDRYVTATTAPKAATPPRVTAGATPVTAAPAPAQVAAVAPAPAPVPDYDDDSDHDDDDDPPTASPPGAIPPPPPGCREAEWDSEHRVWKCAGPEGDDD
jgi:hypothetical protein